MAALHHGIKYVETSPETIDFLLKSDSWRSQGYINYKGVRVYEKGKRQSVEEKESLQSSQILHGDKTRMDNK